MSSDVDAPSCSASKKVKLTDENEKNTTAEDLSAHFRLNSFESFSLQQILSDNKYSKSVFFECLLDEKCAVVLLEKLPLAKETIEKLLNNADLALNLKANCSSDSNAIDYACYPPVDKGDVKATIIYPATSKHIEKYQYQPRLLFCETAEVYKTIVLPFLESQTFSNKWVYNILEHKSEVERIVYEDPDPEIGFVLLPDLKWDESEKNFIYLIAICHARNIKSLRDLTSHHLPLLNNIKSKCLDVIFKKFNIPPEQLRVYLHYQPSYYHLHVHFTSLHKSTPGSQFEKAHLLDTVIQNIELCPSYYQKASLICSLKPTDALFRKLKENSLISE
ncbi:m7GpppX diphosphatase-like [Uloborus diversus]|uniref:m7GpppX diphosphatase-like n=1 Tax=Uloborus diversus TaxID=327109 RepID=UPI0024092C11|nr:m7GpppX diphosphatase-like [Uloborus diversus]